MVDTAPSTAECSRFSVRLARPLWTGTAAVVLFFLQPDLAQSAELDVGEQVMVVTTSAQLKLGEKVVGLPGLGELLKIGNPGPGVLTKVRGDWLAIADFTAAADLPPYGHVAEYLHKRGNAWAAKSEYENAVKDYTTCLRIDQNAGSIPDVQYDRAVAYQHLGRYAEAIKDLRKCTQQKHAWDVHHARLAWLLATCPDAGLRDGKRAVRSAEIACEKSKWKNASFIDTLAAALAEADDFDAAIEKEKRAFELASETERAEFEHRLEIYQAGKPYRRRPPAEKGD